MNKSLLDLLLDKGIRLTVDGKFAGLDVKANLFIRSLDAYLKERDED